MTGQHGPYPACHRFNAETTGLLEDIREVLTEYADHLLLSVRSVCYILVGKNQLRKTAKDRRVCTGRGVRATWEPRALKTA